MKKILYILVLFVWGLYSCEDYLEVEPKNKTVMSNYDNVKAAMGSCLAQYSQGNRFDYGVPFYTDPNAYRIFTYYSGVLDDQKYLGGFWARNFTHTFHSSLEWYNESLHPGIWNSLYSGIGFYNTILDELSRVTDASEDDENLVKAEAKFLRAWNLFKLMQYFSPNLRNDLGIPVNLNAQDVLSYNSERKTQKEVYDLIIAELEEILTYTTKATEFSIFYDHQMIKALLAQVYMYKAGSGGATDGDYDKAISYAQAAMQDKEMVGLDNFDELFQVDGYGLSKDKPGCLMVHTPVKYVYSALFFEVVRGNSNYGLINYASERLYKLFADDDVRNAWVDNKTGAIDKFKGLRDTYYFFRIADMQLIIAEAYARKGDETQAIVELEKFQVHRFYDYVGYTGDNVLQEILDERLREFCFEYDKVWLDMSRTGKGFTRPAVDKPEEEITYTLEDNDYRLTLPIPLFSELEENRIEQNPGWNFN